MSASSKAFHQRESPEKKAERIAKASASNRKPHNFSKATRRKMAKLMSARAAEFKAQGKKWGKGGWNKGIPHPPDQRKKISEHHKEAIAKGEMNPQGRGSIGIKSSIKTAFGKIRCDSTWEHRRVSFLVQQSDVKNLIREPYRLAYRTGGVEHTYIPDYQIEYHSGRIVLEEVKPKQFCDNPASRAKFKAARAFCRKRGLEFRVLMYEHELVR
jgi:hypothetical protein